MSIIDPASRWGHAPEFVSEFETDEEWASYICETYFPNLVAGEPFLLVVRRIAGYLGQRMSGQHSWMETELYIGILTDDKPLCDVHGEVGGVAGNRGFSLATREFISFPDTYHAGKMKSHVHGRLEFQRCLYFSYTPVKESFAPPSQSAPAELYDQKVHAFTVACGVPAMEALALDTVKWKLEDFLGWYVRSCMRLNIPLLSAGMQTEKTVEIVDLFARLLKWRAFIRSSPNRREVESTLALMQRNIAFAKEVGLHEDMGKITIDGLRYRKAEFLEDIEELCNQLARAQSRSK